MTKDLDDERQSRVRAEAAQVSSCQRQADAENERDRLMIEWQAAQAQLRSLSSMFGLTGPPTMSNRSSSTTKGQPSSPATVTSTKRRQSEPTSTKTALVPSKKRLRPSTGSLPSDQKQRRRGPFPVDSGDDDEEEAGRVLASLSIPQSESGEHRPTGGTPDDPIHVGDDDAPNKDDNTENDDNSIENDHNNDGASGEDDHHGSCAPNRGDPEGHGTSHKDDHNGKDTSADDDGTDGGSSPGVSPVQRDQGRGGPGREALAPIAVLAAATVVGRTAAEMVAVAPRMTVLTPSHHTRRTIASWAGSRTAICHLRRLFVTSGYPVIVGLCRTLQQPTALLGPSKTSVACVSSD
ncbi:hypothetical protein P3T76_006493 [Phytophthora citrophthora]|uniref:Uncharacterized protein n=1 Tax=Phytophthora citrophthora TaxID=4793 RepID=A0AAD9LN89_9STRA|nr:hypothetical protein P3T76_006493 [Phytophthora citrophthora]